MFHPNKNVELTKCLCKFFFSEGFHYRNRRNSRVKSKDDQQVAKYFEHLLNKTTTTKKMLVITDFLIPIKKRRRQINVYLKD